MALTYTEIEQEKNTRILIFFALVLLFYFATALVLGSAAKLFLASQAIFSGKTSPFLSTEATVHILFSASVIAAIHIWFSMSHSMSFIKKNLNAQYIDLTDRYHQRFQTILEEVNVATGSKYKIMPVVIPTVAMNAFAISDSQKNAVVGVTEGLLSKLTRQQLQAVVAHEVGHVASGDSFQTTIGCSLFGIYAAMLSGMRRTFQEGRFRTSGRGGGGAILFLIFIFLILSVMQFFYSIVRFALSRDRELRADAIAVRLTRDPIALSEALYAIQIGWRGLGCIDSNLESLFIINPAVDERDEREDFWSSLMSTHPPISKRMKILADMAHADVENIKEKVIAQEKLKESTREMPAGKGQQRWMFMDEQRKWQGPFNISQIMVMGWLRPDTWIKAFNQDALKQAKDELLLKPIFDGKMEGLKASSRNCPKCNQALVDEEYEGTELQRCLFCQGVLADREKASRIMVRKEKGFDERIKKLAKLAQKNGVELLNAKIQSKEPRFIKCPGCGAKMIRRYYTLAYLIEVHKCAYCSLIWFDKDELEMVQYLIENQEAARI